MIDMSGWDNARLLKEFESRVALYHTLTGWLYASIVHDEIEDIGEEAINRTGLHPNHWRNEGIVPATWTDHLGIVHAWKHNHQNYARKYDDPVKDITCFECSIR